MSRPAAPVPFRTDYPRALLGVYVRTTLWYLGLVALLWVLGFEAIHGHPTPFYALIDPIMDTPVGFWWLGALAAALLAVLLRWVMPHVIGLSAEFETSVAPHSRRQLACLVAFAALFATSVASMRGGLDGISAGYSRQTYEYVGDIGLGGSIPGLFRDYEKIHPYLSMHSKVHPPGPVAILWLLSYVAGREALALSIATIIFGSLSVVPMYFLARDMLGMRAGLIATLLYTLMPSIVLFTATSADIAFMPFTLTTLLLFWRAIHPDRSRPAKRLAYALGAGAGYGLMGLISFSLVSVGAFFVFAGLWRMRERAMWWPVLRTALLMLAAALAIHYLAHLCTGYNSIRVFQLSKAQFDTDQLNLDLSDPRWPAWTFRLVNPLCWFFFAGIPVSVLALRRLASSFAPGRGLFVAIGLTLGALDILYLARGEGERSAMYIMPFLALLAAPMLDEISAAARSWRPVNVTLAFLGVQCIVIEAFLYTYW